MDEKDKKEYEVAVLLHNEEAKEEILRVFAQRGVEVREEGPIKKIALAYPIKHATQAYFAFFYTLAVAADIKSLEKDLRNTTSVLRSLIITLPPVKKSSREDAQKPRRQVMPRRPMTATSAGETPKQQQHKPISNEALTKKIEEILQ
jgi:ribosomal protein S6